MSVKVRIEVDQAKLKELVLEYLREQVNFPLTEKDVKIETKSAQNYRSEWESGAGFRAVVEKS